MTEAELRAHVAGAHDQGDYVFVGGEDGLGVPPFELLGTWHEWEHRPSRTTHLKHAHDEISARRYGVELTAP